MSDNGTLGGLPMGQRLAVLRIVMGQQKKELAAALDCDPSAISRWESGERPIPESWLDQIKKQFGIDLRDSRWDEEKFLAIPPTPKR